MAFPSIYEFTKLLESTPPERLERIVKGVVFPGVPFVFRDDPAAYDGMRNHLSSRLNIAVENITIIGSGKSGYSLSPDTFAQAYSERSDIDVLMVDEGLFDAIWYSIVDWHFFVRSPNMNGDEKRWIAAKQKALYWGWLAIDDLLLANGIRAMYHLRTMRDIRTRWFNAFRSLAQIRGLERLDISGRLYRSWQHAILYHADSLRQVKDAIKRKS